MGESETRGNIDAETEKLRRYEVEMLGKELKISEVHNVTTS